MSDGKMMSQAEFARAQGWSRAYVTGLKKAGRLKIQRVGKRDLVLVAESLALLEETKDVNRQDVVQRNAQAKQQAGGAQQPDDHVLRANNSQAASKAVTEEYKAKSAKLAYEREIGLVVETKAVEKAAAEVATLIRTTLNNLPDQLAPELLPLDDIQSIQTLLSERFEQVLKDMSQQMKNGIGLKS
jgi:hypothetical protein